MHDDEKVIFAVEISKDFNTELQQVIEQSGLSTTDALKDMVKCFTNTTLSDDQVTNEVVQKIAELIKRLEDKYPETGYIPVAVLLQQTQAELIANAKNLLNKLYPETFAKPQKPKALGFIGY